MATITATNGTDYPLWALRCQVKDASSSLSFTEFENELGDGYYSQTLYGSSVGNRAWSVSMPSLQRGAASTKYDGPDGGSLTAAEYITDLFHYCKVTGRPFVYRDPETDQYYFARFADRELTKQRVLAKLYSSGVQIKQARIPGVSVFDPANIEQLWAHYDPTDFTGTSWPDATGNGHDLPTVTGDVQHVANAQNGQYILRFNWTTPGGHITSTHDVTVYDFIAVLRMDEDTFSNYAGVCSGATTGKVLVGNSGTTRFYYFGENDPYKYWLNNTEYERTGNAQAPMNAFGIVHARFTDGVSVPDLQIGKDRNYTDRYAKMSVGDIAISDELMPMATVWELIESLAAKYRLNVIGQ